MSSQAHCCVYFRSGIVCIYQPQKYTRDIPMRLEAKSAPSTSLWRKFPDLSMFWDDMEVMQKSKIVASIVQFENLLHKTHFASMEACTIPMVILQTRETLLSVPRNNRKYSDDGRSSLVLDRGPCKSMNKLEPFFLFY